MDAIQPVVFDPSKVTLTIDGVYITGLGESPIQCQQLKRYWHLPRIKNQTRFQRK